MANCIYGQLNEQVVSIDYEGLTTPTAQVDVDNEARTIAVNVIDSPNSKVTVDSLSAVLQAGEGVTFTPKDDKLEIDVTPIPGPAGKDGPEGPIGPQGVGVEDIELTPKAPEGENADDVILYEMEITLTDGRKVSPSNDIVVHQGSVGPEGPEGKQGPAGRDGERGLQGTPGDSAYQIWLNNGHTGTEIEFLNWLKSSDVAIIPNVPETATEGTLTADQISTANTNENSYIMFNHEKYYLMDKGHKEGYITYTHVGYENNIMMLKSFTITLSTGAWVINTVEIPDDISTLLAWVKTQMNG